MQPVAVLEGSMEYEIAPAPDPPEVEMVIVSIRGVPTWVVGERVGVMGSCCEGL